MIQIVNNIFWLVNHANNTQYHPLCCGKHLFNIPIRNYPSCSGELVGIEVIDEPLRNKIIQSLWPIDFTPPNLRTRQNIIKNIKTLTCYELRKELSKRDLSSYTFADQLMEPKQEYILRLTSYYEKNETNIKQMMEMLIHGYCRNTQSRYSLTIPAYLVQMIHKYFPLLFS